MATGLRHKSLEIKVVTAELDIPQLAGVKTAAFRDSPLHAAMYPVKNENAMLEFYGARERVELLNPMQTLVAVVDTSRSSPAIIAYARWTTVSL
jgi:surfactin synthase thioesterase subunit